MVEIKDLVKNYGSKNAVDGISFTIKEGEVVGFLGPNGAGKSTTMNIITGYLSATSGTVTVGGKDIFREPLAVKKQIGFLPEQPPVYPDMTVSEYLNFVFDLKGCTLEREAHISQIMGQVKITDVRDRLIKNLSKGYRQRVGIAQALIGEPKVIIFDEPTVGLDPKQILEVRNLIRMLSKKHTVILSTHILAEVQAVCERIIIINRGRIIADERTEDITRTINDGFSVSVKISGPQKEVLSALRRLRGVKNCEATGERELDAYAYVIESERGVDIRKPLFSLCASNSWPILGLAPSGTDLESIFIKLVDSSDGQKTADNKRRRAH